jgi:hypothetical protein
MSSSVRNLFTMLLSLALTIAAISVRNAWAVQQQPGTATAHTASIACRVMERHADKEHSTVLILFHQRDKSDQPKLKEFLLQHDGGAIQIQINSGEWQKATVWRIRNCFGRGLLVLPEAAAPKEHATFTIRTAQ